MTKTPIERLQNEELSIFKEFIRICKKHGFRYYILGGTLLGAVRHQGFIPWDDDIDVSMPRKDYEAFLRLPSSEFADGFQIVSYYNNTDYKYSWGRLISKNMKIINHMANIPREEYAWIDLIPLDSLPDSAIARFFHKMHLSFWWNLNQICQFDELVDQKRKRSFAGRLAIKVAGAFKWIGKILDYQVCLRKLNQVLMKYPYDSGTSEIVNFLAAYGFDEVFPRKSFGKGRIYEFSGIKVNGPADYDTVCTIIYGSDYMTPPPESERNKHHAEIVNCTNK